MARRKDRSKHPALRELQVTKEVALTKNDVKVDALHGWDLFDADMQRFLMILPCFRVYKDAAEYIGQDEDWFKAKSHGRTFEGKMFARAARNRRTQKAVGIDGYYRAMFLKAQIELDLLIHHDDPAIQLRAIAMVRADAGTIFPKQVHKQAQAPTTRAITQPIVQMNFSRNNVPEHLTVIEGEAHEIVDEDASSNES
jgi:hypothetical protein